MRAIDRSTILHLFHFIATQLFSQREIKYCWWRIYEYDDAVAGRNRKKINLTAFQVSS